MIGKKYDGEKPKMYLLPPKALTEVAKVLTFGANKYDENNWKKLDNLQNRYSGAALRHIFSHMDGEELDNETGLDHLAHAICCLLFKLESKLEAKSALDCLAELTQTIEEMNSGTSKEERPRKPIGQQYEESYTLTFNGRPDGAHYEEAGVRDAEYSIQYDKIRQAHRRLSRAQGVCQVAEKPATGSPSFEYRDFGNGYSISARRVVSGDLEGDISKYSVLQKCD